MPGRRSKAAHRGSCKYFQLSGTEMIGMVRDEAGERVWNQTVQGSYFALKVMRGSWKGLK